MWRLNAWALGPVEKPLVHFQAIDAGQLIETILGLFWQTTKEYGYRLRAKSFVCYGAIKYALISEGHVLYVRVRR